MDLLVENFGGNKALKLRFIFLIIAVVIICSSLKKVQPQKIPVAAPVTEPETELVTEPETTIEPTTEETTEAIKHVVMSVTSVQNDIRIKFYTEYRTLITGNKFTITLQFPDGTKKEYSDNDMDGRLNIENIAAGNYIVLLNVPEKYVALKSDVAITVKDKVVYKPVENIKDDIAPYDPSQDSKPTPIEKPEVVLKDTVEWVTSSKNTQYIKLLDNSKIVVPNLNEEEATSSTGEDASNQENQQAEGEKTIADALNQSQLDLNAPLKTSEGEVLYLKVSENNYVEARNSDYSEDGEYYIAVVKYTGWQTLDGKRYYFDKNNKPVTGNQIIQGAKYSFDANGVLSKNAGSLGIDISIYQGTLSASDWQAVKNSGIQFVILRCGYRGWGSAGKLMPDSTENRVFEANYKGAKAVGLKVGVYFFSQATSEAEAVEEASVCLSYVKGKQIDLPIFLDIETSSANPNLGEVGRADRNSKETWTAVAKAFCKTIKNSGYKAGIYANKNYLTNRIDASQIEQYYIWLAHYTDKTDYTGKYDMWQYTSDGSVAGINGRVDMDHSYIYD